MPAQPSAPLCLPSGPRKQWTQATWVLASGKTETGLQVLSKLSGQVKANQESTDTAHLQVRGGREGASRPDV